MASNYIKIFGGNAVIAERLTIELRTIGIEAVVKDEAESARLGGFATSIGGLVEVFVHKDEELQALKIVNEIASAT